MLPLPNFFLRYSTTCAPPARAWCLLAVLVLWTGAVGAQPTRTAAEEAFANGVTLYNQGAYEKALVAFQQAEASGYESGELYYNMGNAHFRLNELGPAILYYERARQRIPYNPELQHSLRVAEAQTENDVRYLPRPFWVHMWTWALAHLGPTGLFGFGLLLYLGTAGMLGYRIWSGRPNAWIRRITIVTSILSLLLVAAGFFSSIQQANFRSAVVIARESQVLDSPSAMGTVRTTVYEGLVCDVIERRTEWAEVYLPNGTTGWVPAGDIVEI